MRRKLFLIRAILFFSFIFSFFQMKADKEASPFQLDFSDTITAEFTNYLPVLVFDSLEATDLVPFTLPYDITYWKARPTRKKTSLEVAYDSMKTHNKLARRSVYNIAITRPDLIDFYGLESFDETLNSTHEKWKDIHVEGVDEPQLIPTPFHIEQPKRSREDDPWTFKGNLTLHFSQYYVTDNWSKGGTPNATFLSLLEYAIYYKKNRWLWENRFEVKVGFYNTYVDTLRAIRVSANDNRINAPTYIGLQTKMSKKLYYSAYFEFETPILTGYKKTNSQEVLASFLSPAKCYIGFIGLDYKHNKSATLRVYPLAYKFVFILPNTKMKHNLAGLDDDQYHIGFTGYIIQAKLNWKISKEIQLRSEVRLFNSYNFKNIDLGWETTGSFTINRYLSSRLALNMIFDNTPKNEKAKIQIQEQLSFGFSYHFQ